MPDRINTPVGPSTQLNLPRARGNRTPDALMEINETILRSYKAKKDVEDTIEANKLLAEHGVRAREIQSELMRTDLREDQLIPAYTAKLEELNKDLIGRASPDV